MKQFVAGVLAALPMMGQVMGQTTFNMWPYLDPAQLASALGFSQTCLTALNTTVNCDPDLFRMAGSVDQYLWSSDNVTALCGSDCINSVSSWVNGVWNNCSNTDTITIGNKLVPAYTVAQRYIEGTDLACLTDNKFTIVPLINNASLISSNGSSSGNGSSMGNSTDIANSTVTIEYNNATSNYCFLQAQNWTGTDTVDCTNSTANCSDPNAGTRIANLYDDSVLCSSCFLSVMWHRVNSPFLPNSDYSDFLIDQFRDIQDVCNLTIKFPDTQIRPVQTYAIAPAPTYLPPDADPNNNSSTSANATCNGQTITPGTSGCNALSTKYGVTSGDLQASTNSSTCASSAAVCVPRSCNVTQITSARACADIATSLSTSTLNVTLSLFLQWNPNIMGLCDNITFPQYICVGPPGGSFTLPPPINGTNTNADGQQRGGQGSGSNPNGPLGPSGPTANSTQTAPTQAGIASNCNLFAYARTNDTCYGLTQAFNITLALLTTWNPVLGYPDGKNCTTQFWAGYDYCVGVSSNATSSSGSSGPTSSRNTVTPPYPTQSGIDPACNTYVEATSGDYCVEFASRVNISTASLYQWNKILGPNGANCSTNLQAGNDYCVGVSTTASATSTIVSSSKTSSTPVPTQSGIASNCIKIVQAQSGDTCYNFAQTNNITTTQLYTWNPVLGNNGQNCSTQFQAGDGYCVKVSS